MAEQQLDVDAARSFEVAGELRAVIGRLSRRLREESSPGDFTDSQKSVLGRLEREGPATLTALARENQIKFETVQQAVKDLGINPEKSNPAIS